MKRERKLKRKARKQSTYLTKIRSNTLRLIKPVPDAQTKKLITGSHQHLANMLA
jgi:predicted DNA-binding protein (MmcQ/YjbR family)